MPLRKGSSRAVISENIREMVAAGHPQRQAVAAALRTADKGAKMNHPHEGHHPHEKHPMEHHGGREQREGHKHDGHEKSIFKGMEHSAMHGRDAHEKPPSGKMPKGGMKHGA
jgi:hypothetical protein